MSPEFLTHLQPLHSTYEELLASPRYPLIAPATRPPKSGGVYVFWSNGKALYVGRCRNLRQRLAGHHLPSMGTQSAGFAYRLARIATGHVTPTYRSGRGSRKWLQTDPEFMAAFVTAKSEVAAMSVQYVVMEDDVTQALLEIYCAVVLQTPHNSFRTT